MRKLFYFLPVLALVALMSFVFFKPNENPFGVWLWNDSLGQEYVDFAIKNGINEIYYCNSNFDDNTKAFIKYAKSKKIKVYFLCGEHKWIEDSTKLHSRIEKYLDYNNKNPNESFSGIHLDVEPHVYDDFDERQDYYMQKYVQFVASITQTYKNIKFDFDIPFWFNMLVEHNGQTKEAYKFVFDYAARVFVMSYRDSSTKIYDVAKEELAYALKTKKPIFLCVETGNEEDIVSFKEEGKEYMYNELKSLEKIVNQKYGLAIHHLESWYEMTD